MLSWYAFEMFSFPFSFHFFALASIFRLSPFSVYRKMESVDAKNKNKKEKCEIVVGINMNFYYNRQSSVGRLDSFELLHSNCAKQFFSDLIWLPSKVKKSLNCFGEHL